MRGIAEYNTTAFLERVTYRRNRRHGRTIHITVNELAAAGNELPRSSCGIPKASIGEEFDGIEREAVGAWGSVALHGLSTRRMSLTVVGPFSLGAWPAAGMVAVGGRTEDGHQCLLER